MIISYLLLNWSNFKKFSENQYPFFGYAFKIVFLIKKI
jgi:hypothetical protein